MPMNPDARTLNSTSRTSNTQSELESCDVESPIDVVIPTRNRPVKLKRCLTALAGARGTYLPTVYVVDSSTSVEDRMAVDEVCREFSFAQLHRHSRDGLAAARNECTRAGSAPLVISVDDDVYVTASALDRLVSRYCQGDGWRIVAGSVAWGEQWSGPIMTRPIGYGTAGSEENADFYVTALILYPRELVRQFPFNESIPSSDDRFAGALWRSKGVQLLWEPDARARHDDEHNVGLTTPYHQRAHIYVNLFDGIFVRRSPRWALSVEVLGFLAGARRYMRSGATALTYMRAWTAGHVALLKDWRMLRRMASQPVVGSPPECSDRL